MPLGADIMSAAFNLLATDMADDERVLLFLERIEEAAMAAADNKSESVDASSKRASETAVDEEVNLVELESPEEIQNTASATAEAVLQDINVLSFEELHLLQTQINAAQDGWRLFLSTSASQEAAGEAIYSALLEGAPSLQSLFTSPRAVQARIICIKDFLYDWDVGHLRRGEDPVVVIFEWWEPDASILLNHGSAALPSEYTAIKSADWTRSDRMQSATKGTARSEVPTTCQLPRANCHLHGRGATQLVQWYRSSGLTNLKDATGQHLLVFCDNLGILSAAVSGRSSVLDVNSLLTGLHLLLTSLRVTSWWEHIDTHANPADGGSRQGTSCKLAKRLWNPTGVG